MSPYEAWTSRKPNVSHLHVFGCISYAHILDHIRRKLENKSENCVFIGYIEQSKAYILYNPVTKKFVVRRDVQFQGDKSWDDKIVGSFFPSAKIKEELAEE